ncbi:hypothetical protein [Helicobacter apodemus]
MQGFENAEVSGGGISASSVNIDTLESKTIRGFYIMVKCLML